MAATVMGGALIEDMVWNECDDWNDMHEEDFHYISGFKQPFENVFFLTAGCGIELVLETPFMVT